MARAMADATTSEDLVMMIPVDALKQWTQELCA